MALGEMVMGVAKTEFSEYFFENNPSFTATDQVVEFTRPLRLLGLAYFTFDRHYADGSRIVLTNHAEWIRFYWESGLYKKAIFENSPAQFSNGHVFWEWLNREPIYSAAALRGIERGVTLTNKYPAHCDFFHFGAINNSSINGDLVLRNMDRLCQFTSIFVHKMKPLIAAAEKDKIFGCLPDSSSGSDLIGNVDFREFNELMIDLVGKRDFSRIYLGEEFDFHYLTRSEIGLLKSLIAGKSCSEISRAGNISVGAIDKRVKSIKEKLGCKTLCHLGFILGRLDLKVI